MKIKLYIPWMLKTSATTTANTNRNLLDFILFRSPEWFHSVCLAGTDMLDFYISIS